MKSWITALARTDIQELKAYESARSLNIKGSIFLDANESPFAADKFPMNRYPEPQPKSLQKRISELYQVSPQNFVMGRGSDEAIDILIRTFCEARQDRILICPPTYGVYEVSSKIQGAQVERVPLLIKNENATLDEENIKKCLNDKSLSVKIVFLCSPNNPTGTSFDSESMKRICEMAEGKSLVVIDEAYIEFAEQKSMTQFLQKYKNLVILRTLSKAWALAGVRFGVAIGSEEVISLMQKVRAPYPLGQPIIETVLAATDRSAMSDLNRRIETIKAERSKLIKTLKEMKPIKKIFSSDANFICVEMENATKIFETLKTQGLILRDRSREPGLSNCLRISIGTAEENKTLISELRKIFA